MTDTPIWPGVAEYLYQAASSARVLSDGTRIVPFGLTPRCSSFECTPIAGISTDTGSERRSGAWAWPPNGPRKPAAVREGCGACTWAAIATPIVAAPATMRRTPATPATRARRLGLAGGGAYPACGQDMTTRNPAIRRQSRSPDMATSLLPRGVLLA